jgi:hypothetical protein
MSFIQHDPADDVFVPRIGAALAMRVDGVYTQHRYLGVPLRDRCTRKLVNERNASHCPSKTQKPRRNALAFEGTPGTRVSVSS